MDTEQPDLPLNSQIIVRKTWLNQRPNPKAFLNAIIIVGLISLICLLYWIHNENTGLWGAASHDEVFVFHQYWKAWTTLFAHGDIKHLLSNLFLLFFLGSFLQAYFGFFVFPIAAFFFGGVTNLLVLYFMESHVELLGASGIVYWLGGTWLTLYFFLEIRKNYIQRFLRASGVAIVLFFPAEAFDPQISYLSHSVGFFSGILFGIAFYKLNKIKFQSALVTEEVFD